MTCTVTIEVEGLDKADALAWVDATLRARLDVSPLTRKFIKSPWPKHARVTTTSSGSATTIFRIKTVREHTLCGLKEAKEAVEACQEDTAAAIALLTLVGIDNIGRAKRPWTAEELTRVLERHGIEAL